PPLPQCHLSWLPLLCPSRAPPVPPPSLLFFYCSRDHRDLHSFPTRRSSDLSSEDMAAAMVPHMKPDDRVLLLRAEEANAVLPDRSEEHTSELQSRFDLVCRLLLEKKKKTKQGAQQRAVDDRTPTMSDASTAP